MRAAVDIGWRLAGLALTWIAGVAVHLQQRSLWPIDVYVATIAGATDQTRCAQLNALGQTVAAAFVARHAP